MIDSFHSLMRSLTAINRANTVKTDVDNVVTPALFQSKKAKLYQSTMRHLVHRDRGRPLTEIELLKLTGDDDDEPMAVTKPLLRLRKEEPTSTHTRPASQRSSDPLSSEATPPLLGWPLLRQRTRARDSGKEATGARPSGPVRHNLPRMKFLVVGVEPKDTIRRSSRSRAVTDDGFRLLRLPKKRSQVDRKYSPSPRPEVEAEKIRRHAETGRNELLTHSNATRSRQHAPTDSDAERSRVPHAPVEPNGGRMHHVHTESDQTFGRLIRTSAESGRTFDQLPHETAEAETGHYVPAELDTGRAVLRYAPTDACTQTSTNATSQTDVPEAATAESKQVKIHITNTAVQTSGSLAAEQIQPHIICTHDQEVQVSGDFSQQTMPGNLSKPDAAIAPVAPDLVEAEASPSAKPRGQNTLLDSVSSDSVSSIDEGGYFPTYRTRRVTAPFTTTTGETGGIDRDPRRASATSGEIIANNGAGNEENRDDNGGNDSKGSKHNLNQAFAPISARMLQLQSQLDRLTNHADNLEEEMGDHHHRMHVVSKAHQSHILQWHKALHDADTENSRAEVNRTLHRALLAKAYNSPSNHPAAQDGENAVAPPHWSQSAEEYKREQQKVIWVKSEL